MDLAIPGMKVGHWTDEAARTGCTVVVFAEGTPAAGEVRGGAPATREFALLDPRGLVGRIDAVVLCGGSAFGLAACDGVVERLGAAGRGFPTAVTPVPLVVGMALYDLAVGSPDIRPGPGEGRAAFDAATASPAVGPVGAGTGATVGKWRGRDRALRGGVGICTLQRDEVAVTAVVAVNAAGEIDDGTVAAALLDGSFADWPDRTPAFENTTIGVVATNAALTHIECQIVAEGAHDGLGRAVIPPHMRSDGDGFVVAASGPVDAHVDDIRLLAVMAVEQAVRNSVGTILG